MRHLVFYTDHNTPDKRDGDEFKREALAYAKCHGVRDEDVICIEAGKKNPFALRGPDVLNTLDEKRDNQSCYDAVAFFCHGHPNKIQLGFDSGTTDILADMLAWVARQGMTVVLYCCSTARDDDGNDNESIGDDTNDSFADKLRDELVTAGVPLCKVVAHHPAGHTTRNKRTVFFVGPEENGGHWAVVPRSKYWRTWCKALDDGSDFRFRFPFMTALEIERELEDKKLKDLLEGEKRRKS